MMKTLFQTLAAAALLGLAGQAGAQQAGYRTLTVPGDAPISVALFYPTAAVARALPMGPWQPWLHRALRRGRRRSRGWC